MTREWVEPRRVTVAEWAAAYGEAVPPAGPGEPLPFQRAILERLKPLPPAPVHVTNPAPRASAFFRWGVQRSTLPPAVLLMMDEVQTRPALLAEDDCVSCPEIEPLVKNLKAPGDLEVGDYVFASRWTDCDPGDPWHIGYVSEVGSNYVVIGAVSCRRWPNAMRITEDQGDRIAKEFPPLEQGRALPYAAIARVFGVPVPAGWVDPLDAEE